MRSLFLRVFLWFWLAMALVAAVLVVTSPFFTRSRPALERWHEDSEKWARHRVDGASTQIGAHGLDEFQMGGGHGRRGRSGEKAPPRLFVIGEDGAELRGGGAPPEVHHVAERALVEQREQTERIGALYLIARPVADPGGRRVAVVAAHHSPPRLVHLLDPKALSWRFGVLVLVVGALSFWLARYLSSPVAPLRSAARRLSGGDLTARVEGKVARRRDEIGELARDFDAMAERIEALVDSQQRLLRDVSHELRSPLARLVVALELARSRAGEDAAVPLDRIEREAERLEELIGRLLLLERLEAGGAKDVSGEVDLAALLVEVVADAGFEAAADGIEVRFDSSDECRITGRSTLLRSAFDNVIRNAVHHTDPGSSVDVVLATNDRDSIVTIGDHGPGVPAAELDRIFEPFYRVDEARDRVSGGVGLGLAIAARAVRVHGGTIEAENHPDGGLVVKVRLPA